LKEIIRVIEFRKAEFEAKVDMPVMKLVQVYVVPQTFLPTELKLHHADVHVVNGEMMMASSWVIELISETVKARS